jgi:hypothetical protein
VDEGTDPGEAGTILGSWADYEVTLDSIHCLEESSEWSDSDEVFVIALLVNHTSADQNMQKYLKEPIEIDRGDTKPIGHTFTARIPKAIGALSLPIVLFESDQESANTRREIRDRFAAKVEEKTASHLDRIVKVIGAMGPGSWKLEWLRVFAFRRNWLEAEAIMVFDDHVGELIGPGGSYTVNFQLGNRYIWSVFLP